MTVASAPDGVGGHGLPLQKMVLGAFRKRNRFVSFSEPSGRQAHRLTLEKADGMSAANRQRHEKTQPASFHRFFGHAAFARQLRERPTAASRRFAVSDEP
jgi:hypothetical protein